MLKRILSNRTWDLKFSLKKRNCYITGDSLWLTWAYRGRRYITSFISGNKPVVDDIWLSKEQFLTRYARNEI